jgi:hypothetical protein
LPDILDPNHRPPTIAIQFNKTFFAYDNGTRTIK